MTLSIRTLTNDDLDQADEIVVAAYNASRSRKAALHSYLRLQPDGWILVLWDNIPAGLGGLVDYGNFAYLGMMSVHPSMQRKGVGKTLMQHLLAWSDAQGCPTVLLDATNAGAQLYRQFGFVEVGQTSSWLGSQAFTSAPLYSGQQITIASITSSDLAALARFDAAYFGADRTRVLADLLHEHQQRAFLARDLHGEITGYIYAQNTTIGPWVASSAPVAEQLLMCVQALPFVDGATVNVAQANSEALHILEHHGFRCARVLSHMQRGIAARRDLTHIYGQTSFALG